MASAAVRQRALRTPPRSRRSKTTVSYVESESSSPSDDEAASEDDRPLAHRARPVATTKQTRKHTRLESNEQNSRSKRPRHSKPAPATSSSTAIPPVDIDTTGVVPAWASLPYHILVQIFRYASHPLYEESTFQPLPSGRWLLNVAYLCRSFAEPALTVLYESPPLVPMVQAHRLVDVLEEDPKSLRYGYRPKIKSLRIDVGQVAAYTLPGRGHLDLHGLIKDLPKLEDLEFYHQKDMAPYRQLDDKIKWTYPVNLFEALEYVDPEADGSQGDKTRITALQSWRWSSRLAGKKWTLEMMPEMHTRPFFASLKKIAFVNYQFSTARDDGYQAKDEKFLASALTALPQLTHLIFETSTLMNSWLLPLLPKSLHNLELINCWEVIADDFAAFLLTHGHQLRVLTLNHNQSLSLSFLTVLGSACPKLQVLRMNLTYYNVHGSYRDSEPLYDELLLASQIPVWPKTLQTIEMTQLRKWEKDAAEIFLQSLLDSAGDLVDLRELTIHASPTMSWRDRASLRDRWVASLTRVFKRVSTSPHMVRRTPKLSETPKVAPAQNSEEKITVSKRSSSRLLKQEATTETSVPIAALARRIVSSESNASQPRRSTRASATGLPTGRYAESSDADDTAAEDFEHEEEPIAIRRPKRGLERELAVLKDTAGKHRSVEPPTPRSLGTDSSDEDQALSSKAGKGKQKEIIQGMCEVVELTIDNLRPMEYQYTNEDFLDEPVSGDEEWNGDEDGEGSNAW